VPLNAESLPPELRSKIESMARAQGKIPGTSEGPSPHPSDMVADRSVEDTPKVPASPSSPAAAAMPAKVPSPVDQLKSDLHRDAPFAGRLASPARGARPMPAAPPAPPSPDQPEVIQEKLRQIGAERSERAAGRQRPIDKLKSDLLRQAGHSEGPEPGSPQAWSVHPDAPAPEGPDEVQQRTRARVAAQRAAAGERPPPPSLHPGQFPAPRSDQELMRAHRRQMDAHVLPSLAAPGGWKHIAEFALGLHHNDLGATPHGRELARRQKDRQRAAAADRRQVLKNAPKPPRVSG